MRLTIAMVEMAETLRRADAPRPSGWPGSRIGS